MRPSEPSICNLFAGLLEDPMPTFPLFSITNLWVEDVAPLRVVLIVTLDPLFVVVQFSAALAEIRTADAVANAVPLCPRKL